MVDTDPHASKAQLDDPHDNPQYDSNSDGEVDQVADAAVDHDQTSNRTHSGDDISPASVTTPDLINQPNNTNPENVNGERNVISSDETTIFVASTGSDSNDGSSSSPVATIQEAFDRMAHIQNHLFEIVLDDTVGASSLVQPPTAMINHLPDGTGNGGFYLHGDTNNITAVTLDEDQIDFNMLSGDFGNNFVIEAFEYNGQFKGRNTMGRIRNITFSNTKAGQSFGVAGKNTKWNVDNCIFNSGLDSIARTRAGGVAWIHGCSGSVTGDLFIEERGGVVSYGNTNTVEGTFPSTYLFDDWHDGKLTDRATPDHRWKRFYPTWTEPVGNPSASRGFLSLPDGSSTAQIAQYSGSTWSRGNFEFDFDMQAAASSGDLKVTPILQDGNNNIFVQVVDGGALRLRKEDGGAFSTLVSASWGDDTAEHTVRVESSRDIDGNGNAGYELFYDGVSQGSATDSFVPNPDRIRLTNKADVEFRIRRVQAY
jgi:hypothetical protein